MLSKVIKSSESCRQQRVQALLLGRSKLVLAEAVFKYIYIKKKIEKKKEGRGSCSVCGLALICFDIPCSLITCRLSELTVMHTKCWAEWNGPLHLHTWVMLLQTEVALRVGADTALICCSWGRAASSTGRTLDLCPYGPAQLHPN